MIRLLLVALTLTVCTVIPVRQAAADEAAPKNTYTIYLVLWRGETRVEAGLRDYIRTRKLPFKLVVRSIDRDTSKLPAIREEIVEKKPDIVYTWGTAITLKLAGEFDRVNPETNIVGIPIVFVMVSYPVASRLVAAFDATRPNFTGVTPTVPLESQIKAMRSYRPLRRLAVVYNARDLASIINVRELKRLSTEYNFELVARRIPTDEKGNPKISAIPQILQEVAVREPQFLYLGPDSFIAKERDKITNGAIQLGVPAFTATELEILQGNALLGLYARYRSMGELAGYIMERILIHKTRTSDIPIQRLSRFTYAVRMSVARKLGIYPPMSVLDYAVMLPERKK